MTTKTTLASLTSAIVTEADAYRYFENLRWGDSPMCAHCDGADVYLIGCANGLSRKTRTGSYSQRRVWKCRECGRQFSVITATIMQGTKVPVRIWAMVIFEMCASKNGTAAREIERKYGVCPRTAWFMLHRIRAAMAGDGFAVPMQGTIVADETYIGGDPENRHAAQRELDKITPVRVVPGARGNAHTDKTPVFSLVNVHNWRGPLAGGPQRDRAHAPQGHR
ncbi:MAG: transposase [Acidimicrobiales bacterium]|jgi:transposase-like protein